MNQTQTIVLYQPVLYSIALKMVGSLEDAEDIVQDTFMKWLTIDHEKIQNTKAYLVKTVIHHCINHLNTFKKKKNEYLSHLHATELMEKYRESDFARFDLENELSGALAIIHKKLEPVEKGIYLLREVFNFDYEDLQEIFGKKKDNCRQLFSRAKEKLRQENEKSIIDFSLHFQFVDSFKKACTMGHLSDFVFHLKQEALKNLTS